MVIATWGEKKFGVSQKRIDGLEKITLGIDVTTKTKKDKKQEYLVHKVNKPRTISLDVSYYRNLGCDVEAELLEWIRLAHQAKTAYIFVGGRTMGSCKFMLVSVSVHETSIAPDTHFEHAKITLNFSQSTKNTQSTKDARNPNATNILAINRDAQQASESARPIWDDTNSIRQDAVRPR